MSDKHYLAEAVKFSQGVKGSPAKYPERLYLAALLAIANALIALAYKKNDTIVVNRGYYSPHRKGYSSPQVIRVEPAPVRIDTTGLQYTIDSINLDNTVVKDAIDKAANTIAGAIAFSGVLVVIAIAVTTL